MPAIMLAHTMNTGVVDGFIVSIHLGQTNHADGNNYMLLASDREVAVADIMGTTAA